MGGLGRQVQMDIHTYICTNNVQRVADAHLAAVVEEGAALQPVQDGAGHLFWLYIMMWCRWSVRGVGRAYTCTRPHVETHACIFIRNRGHTIRTLVLPSVT